MADAATSALVKVLSTLNNTRIHYQTNRFHVYGFFWFCSMEDMDLCHGHNIHVTCSRVSEVNYNMVLNHVKPGDTLDTVADIQDTMDPETSREAAKQVELTRKRIRELQQEGTAALETHKRVTKRYEEEKKKKEEEEEKLRAEEAQKAAKATKQTEVVEKSNLEKVADLLEVAKHDPSGFRTTVKVLQMVGETAGDALEGAKSKADEVVKHVMDKFVGKNDDEGKAGEEGVKKVDEGKKRC